MNSSSETNNRYVEDEDGFVTVVGVKLSGFVAHDRRCPDRQRITVYSETNDALMCPACNKWLEQACSDPSCDYCANRPEHPLDAGDVAASAPNSRTPSKG